MPADGVKYTTCYMCACRCGIKVHLQSDKIRFIEGNREHPVNRGALCAKGAAGIMQHYSPARLRKPLKRIGPRGKGQFVEIEWEEALATTTQWLGAIRSSDPRKLAFFTGRDQSQALTGWWATQFGTPNHAAHGGFCSVNMAAAGLYTLGGSFWEFGEPDWEHARYLLMFGVAEDHDSNPIKLGLTRLKERGAKFVSVNPVRTGYSAVADEWLGIRPGTDGLFVLSLIHVLLKADRIDLDYLVRYTNAPWLTVSDPDGAGDGLFARDAQGAVLAWDERRKCVVPAESPEIFPKLVGDVELPDGRKAIPVFHRLAERYLDESYAPEMVAERCGVPAATIRRIAAELAQTAFEQSVVLDQPWVDWAGRHHDRMVGRPVSMHAMRGISAHSNGFHTCRAIHLLQILLGAVDTPGAWRYEAPYPKRIDIAPKPAGKPGEVQPGLPLRGMPLGFPAGPEDLLVGPDGTPARIDKAFSWEAPLALHGLMHMVIRNAYNGDPYPIDTLFLYMANMSWNSAMNTAETMEMLTAQDPATGDYRIPHIVYSDAFSSEMVAYADLVLPDTTYLERWDCMSLLDRPISTAEGPADALRQPITKPDRDVRPFQDVMIELGVRLGLPGFVDAQGERRYKDYADYLWRHERRPGIGPLAGWRGENGESEGRGAPNPNQLEKYVENQGFWQYHLPPAQRYFKHANKDYLETAQRLGLVDKAEPVILQLYCEPMQKFRLAAQGHGAALPPEKDRLRILTYFDPLPIWYAPFEDEFVDDAAFPLHAVTQRPMHMYHSWGGQNAWLRQISAENAIYMNAKTATAMGLQDGDWVWLTSRHSRVKCRLRTMLGVGRDTIWTWNAIGKRSGAWNLSPDAPEAKSGFLLNHLISDLLPPRDGRVHANTDPVTGQAAWYDLRVRVEKAAESQIGHSVPSFEPISRPVGVEPPPRILRYGSEFKQPFRHD